MLALSPAFFSTSTPGWPLDQDSISHDQNCFYRGHSETYTSKSYFHHNNNNIITTSSDHRIELDRCMPSTGISGELSTAKKQNHNASERDRRKKINHLYSSLRSLLPQSHHKKKLSIPATISRVLNYIPELQQQVEGLTRKMEDLLSKTSRLDNNKATPEVHDHNQNNIIDKQIMKSTSQGSLLSSSVSASQLVDREVAIQLSSYKSNEIPLSQILDILEEDGLSILDASSFESFGGRVFHNLHLKVEEDYRIECEVLNEKLKSLYDNQNQLFS